MFGYFRFNQLYAAPKLKNIYKNYYCGTCFALEYNYGEIARCILSYDVVILALVAKLYKEPNREILPCFFNGKEKKQFSQDEGWRKVAAINVLLMNAKFDDDINDERSTKAKAAAILFHKAIKKANQQFPELATIINDGYQTMYKLELEKANILCICNIFADMMAELISTAFNVPNNKLAFVRGISRWLYFIDQLDDYDDDVRDGKYNPLVVDGISKRQLIDRDHSYLFGLMRELFRDYSEIKRGLDSSCYEDCLLYAVLNESIPSVTSAVLADKKLPSIIHKSKELEWKGIE